MNLENIVRHEFNDLIDYMRTTDNSLECEDDYLRLLNHTTSEEEKEVIESLKTIRKHLERISDIQDDCFSR